MACTVAVTGTGTTNCAPWASDYDGCNAEICCGPAGGCTGTPSGHSTICNGYGTEALCEQDGCCGWRTVGGITKCYEDADCTEISIYHRSDCAHCGCSAPICPARDCSTLSDNSPDVCAGCDTCPGSWDVVDDRATTPWAITVTGELHLAGAGHLKLGFDLHAGNLRTFSHALHGAGGQLHIT